MMNFRTWFEFISVPPHMPEQWWKKTLKKAEDLEKRFVGKKHLVKKVNDLAKDYYFDTPEYLYYDMPTAIKRMVAGEDSYMSPTLSDRMKEYSQFAGREDSTQRTMSILQNRMKIDIDPKEFIDRYINYYRQESSYEDSIKEVPPEEQQDIKELKDMFSAVFEYTKLLKKMNNYLQTMDDRMKIKISNAYNYEDKVKQPPSKNEETLYHATPFIKEILAQGFKTKEQLGNKEVLGGATDNAIAFTADFKIAKEIAISVKEAIYISKGMWTVGNVTKLMKQEGIPMPKDWILDMKYRKTSNFEMTKNIRQQTFLLYKHYLSSSKKRYDPLFFGVNYQNFEHLDENNVGVLACRCDMTNIARYLQAMEEFRVPIPGIRKIMKAIKV